jgi:hypothetical protein
MPARKIGRLAVRLIAVAIGAGAIIGVTAVVSADDDAPSPAPVQHRIGVPVDDGLATLNDGNWE